MYKKYKPYLLLLVLSILTAGGSMFYLATVAHNSGGIVAKEYPALSGTMMGEYGTLTKNLLEQNVFSMSTTSPFIADAWRTPGYPAFIAFFYSLFGDFYPALIAQIGLLFLTAVLVFQMTRKVLDVRWAYGLSILYVLLPGTVLAASVLLTETLFTFCFILALYLCFFSAWRNIYIRFASAGLLLAIATYVRPASLYILAFFIPAYFLFYLKWNEIRRQHIVAVGLMVIFFVGALLPWYVRNKEQFDHFTFASTGPYVLFRQNATQFYEAYNDIPNLEARYALEDRAGIPRGPVPTGFEYSEVMTKVAIDVISEHPFHYALFHASTFIPFFTSSSVNTYERFVYVLQPNLEPTEEPSLIQALHPFSLPTLLVVLGNHGWTLVENVAWALVTLLVLVGLWRSKDVRLARMFFALAIYFALVTGPIAHARYRMPVEPLLLIGAVSTLAYFIERRKNYLSFLSKKPQPQA